MADHTAITLLSIQVGKVQTHPLADGSTWTSGYVKQPVAGRVFAGTHNLAGDAQHHLKFHGGPFRPILAYSAAHYALWQAELGVALPHGSFGENFTVQGLDETTVCLGDVYQVGDTVRVQVTQPRKPCNQIYKHLRLRGIQQRVDATRRTGWYMRVLAEGEVEAGMPLRLLERTYPDFTIWQVHAIVDAPAAYPAAVARLVACEALTPAWRERLAAGSL